MILLSKICKLIPLLCLVSCVPYKIPTREIAHPETADTPLYKFIPRHRSQIQWYDGGHWLTWALFGNDDCGIYGEDHPDPYHPQHPNGGRKAASWMIRNPLHNFCFYVIGSAHRENSELTLFEISKHKIGFLKHHPKAHRVFATPEGGFLLALHGGKPFLSLKICFTKKHHGDFYLGWRNRGNFGCSFRPWTKNRISAKMEPNNNKVSI